MSDSKLPVLVPSFLPENKQCRSCRGYFDAESAKLKAHEIWGLYYWNCTCGATLIVKGDTTALQKEIDKYRERIGVQ